MTGKLRRQLGTGAFAAVFTLGMAGAAAAAAVRDCGDGPRIDTQVEPWEQNTASYADGAIRVALIDTVEPAAAAVHLVVIAPPMDELGLPGCRLISQSEDGTGFFGLDFAGRRASYDPATGLELTFPIQTYVAETGQGKPATLRVTINQQSGQITARTDP
ncbi:hypothetical protein [Paracoccus pacificus]|uniref:Uncharacterized protein n=1 Tax=Paracoccus pacificus TaxID=1463598 RepID=A0ABW4RAP0_9RHOB